MSSSEDDQQVVAVTKKYKVWKDDDTIPIPLRTLQRWQSNVQSIPSNNDNHEDTAECFRADGADTSEMDNFSDSIDAESLDDNTSDILSNTSENANTDFCDFANWRRIDNSSPDDKNYSDSIDRDRLDSDDSDKDDFNSCDTSINKLLYENSTINVNDSVVALLDLYVHHNWTKASLKHTLNMLHKMLPEDNNMPTSVYKLFQYVENLVPPFIVTKHFYCKKCSCYNCIGKTEIRKCTSCYANETNISFFFEIDVREQIKFLFEKRNLAEKLKEVSSCADENIICDISSGSEYIRVNSRVNRQKYDLTLVLSTDGLQLVRSSKSHCWPLTFVIAELPEHLRESFLLTIGIWYDDESKPNMNKFLEPFCLKLKECFDDGISWLHPTTGEPIVSRIVAPLIIADAPARAEIQNIQNFNGRYGCNICEIKMKRPRRIEGKKSSRIYPYNDEDSKLRTKRRMQLQAQKAIDLEKNHVKGVKGSSVIAKLPLIDLGTCLLPEYMHSVLLGVVRRFVHLWFFERGPWSIKGDIEEIDNFLLSIRPPYFFKRMPRKIAKFYKASEYYNFILFYSLPATVDYLPHEYSQHWILLVKSLFILLQERIRKSPDLEQAEVLLKLFVKETETLYSDRELSYNLHQLQHLVLVVKRWGPLWATSSFPFENFNGFLAKCVHGTKHIGQEIVNKVKIAQGVQALRNHDKAGQNATSILSRESKPQLIAKSIIMTADANDESELLASYSIDRKNLRVYVRAKINNEEYTSKMYKTTKTNSYTIQVNLNDNSIVYGSIRFFFEIEADPLCFLLESFTVEHTKMFYNLEMQAKIDHVIPIKESNKLFLIKCNEIKSMFHLIRVGDYVCKRPNRFKKVF